MQTYPTEGAVDEPRYRTKDNKPILEHFSMLKFQSLLNDYLFKTAVLSDPKLKELGEIKTFSGRIKFCDANFKKIKAGSSRIAYDYNNELVLKLAKNEKGIDQNSTENDGFIQQHYKEIVANVIDYDPNDVWIVSEKAYKINPSQFKSLSGIDFENFSAYLKKRFGNGKLDYIKVENEEELDENNFIHEVTDLMANFAMPAGDICRISSWGKVGNRLVLVDYGLTSDIYERHYK